MIWLYGPNSSYTAVIDGRAPIAVEGEPGSAWRKGLLRKIGYKF